MQRISDLEAEVAALNGENQSLKASQRNGHSHPQPNPEELANALGARLVRVEQNLREDFVGKFAASFLLASETITSRLNTLDQRELDLEARQKSLETKLRNHYAAVGAKLDEDGERQRKWMAESVNLLNQHLAHTGTALKQQQATVKSCDAAAAATAQSAQLCTSFESDFKTLAGHASQSITVLSSNLQNNLRTKVEELAGEAEKSMRPVIEGVKELSEAQLERRLKWAAIGLTLALFLSAGLTFFTQPSPYMMRDAARWRTFNDGLTQEQADRINKVLDEIQSEQKAREEKRNR